jgi:hypothetical protein
MTDEITLTHLPQLVDDCRIFGKTVHGEAQIAVFRRGCSDFPSLTEGGCAVHHRIQPFRLTRMLPLDKEIQNNIHRILPTFGQTAGLDAELYDTLHCLIWRWRRRR